MALSLRIFPSLKQGTGKALDVSRIANGWRRSIRGQDGYYMGDFAIMGDYNSLAQLFYEKLGGHFEERTGGLLTWQGLLYELDLTYFSAGNDGTMLSVTRRRSYDLMYNHVAGTYLDTSNNVQTLAAVTNDQSIAKHGRREQQLLLDGYALAAAEASRDTWLKEYAWPWPRVVGISSRPEKNPAILEVMACGYVFTGNWRYVTAGDGSMANVSDYITEIIETDCEFLQVGGIQTNTLQVKKAQTTPKRAWDALQDLVELGDADGNPWRLYVDNDRRVFYEPVSVTPSYYLRGGKVYGTAGGNVDLDPWQMKPAVVRDLSYPVSQFEHSGWLEDGRDFYVEEVEVGTGSGLVLKSALFEESEILAAQQEYQAQMEGDQASSASGGGREVRHIYEHLGMTRADWIKLSKAEQLAKKKTWWAKRRKRRGSLK